MSIIVDSPVFGLWAQVSPISLRFNGCISDPVDLDGCVVLDKRSGAKKGSLEAFHGSCVS